MALDNFLRNEPYQDAKLFLLTFENKIIFSLGWQPLNTAEQVRYLFTKKALFSSVLRGPAADWYADSTDDAATWDQIITAFLDRFWDEGDKYRHRITVENCVRGKEEIFTKFYHKAKSAVDKGWPLDPNGIQAKRENQQKQRIAKYTDLTVRGLKLNRMNRRAHEFLIEHLNATWDAFQTHNTSTDVIYTVSSDLVHTTTNGQNTKLHSPEQQSKKLTTIFKEQQVNQVNQSIFRPAKGMTNQDRMFRDSARFAKAIVLFPSTAELKPLMMRSKVNRQKITKGAEQFSLTIIIKEGDLILGFRILKISISNPDTGNRLFRGPYLKKVSAHIGADI